MTKLMQGDCLELMGEIKRLNSDRHIIIVTDPPFNVNYHYNKYKDNMPENEYFNMLNELLKDVDCAVVHYLEQLHKLSLRMGRCPTRVVSWVYNSNTAKQHRDIGFYGVVPKFSQVLQPYKNPTDKRIKERIKNGKTGCKLYDWWNENQVKNVSKEKTSHPCQMPLKVMENIIGVLPASALIIDPFMGSGTTGVACINTNRDFIGIELDEQYFEIARKRIREAQK